MQMRAYSILEIKSVDTDQRTFEGIATTPTTDRMGDIVEPKGAQFTLPIPLLWQHNSKQPIGHVTKAVVTDQGIKVTGKIAQIDSPPSLKDELERAWAMIKSGLVRGLSIGFNPLESAQIKDTYSFRFLKWDWLELSAVTIAANSEASITSIKAIDELQLRTSSSDLSDPRTAALALGQQRQMSASRVVKLILPGASGQISKLPKDTDMKTIQERIAAFQAERMAKAARLQELTNKEDGGTSFNDAEKQEFDTVAAEIGEIDGHLHRLQIALDVNKATAIAVNNDAATDAAAALNARAGEQRNNGTGTIISVKSNLAPGQKFARYALALKRAKGDLTNALAMTLQNKDWMDTSPELAVVLKAAVAAGDTTTSGWASQLVYAQNLSNEFVEYLRPQTIIGKLNLRRIPFQSRWGTLTGGAVGYWVGQGKPVPMSKPTVGAGTLAITKAAGLCAIDDELARNSSPAAELIVRDELSAAIVYLLDDTFINPNNGGIADEKPASITYGVTPITASGTNVAAIVTDVKASFATGIAANVNLSEYVWIMPPGVALALSLMQTSLGTQQFPTIGINGGTWQGLPVIVSQTAVIAGSPQYGSIILLVNPRDIFLADDGQVTISISNEASIEMLDNPTNLSTGATAPTTVVSMFQTNSEAIKAVRYINWVKRRTTAAAYIQAVAYA